MAKALSAEITLPYKWQFVSSFKRNSFGWRSDKPIERIKQALAEIKLVGKKDPVFAAEGAILLLQKLSPALMNVDSSSGALGSAVNRAIKTLVPVIANAAVAPALRQEWMRKLWQAIDDDEMPYIETLGDHWGELCAGSNLASTWADEMMPNVEYVWRRSATEYSHYKGTTACLSALLAAGRHEELLALIAMKSNPWWNDRRWGVKALVAMGRPADALRFAQELAVSNDPMWQIAQTCEEVLLSSGMADEAYKQYAMLANESSTNLATFRAICKKYPHKAKADVLNDLIASTPGSEGKWFAAAKDTGLYQLAIDLISNSPADPRTLTRAAKDFCTSQPSFAAECAMAALHWIAHGYGYEITALEAQQAFDALIAATKASKGDVQLIEARVRDLIAKSPEQKFMQAVLKGSLEKM
jgi:hypothetical protein